MKIDMSLILGYTILLFISVTFIQGSIIGEKAESKRDADDTKCYAGLGCFSNSGPFWDRLISFTPESPETIGTKFNLYTRQNPTRAQVMVHNSADSLKGYFEPRRETKMIIHGFIEEGSVDWIKTMTAALLSYGDFNVIAVDWGTGALPLYTQATANTRVVGAQIAQLIQALKKQRGTVPENFHIIGHSLGAHTAGYAGERLNKLGRITGLDPAGPYFEDRDPIVRLDPTDALFVDVIHTDAKLLTNIISLNGGFGIRMPVGHVDFWPNGGKSQPGCENNIIIKTINEGLHKGAYHVACDHIRAIEFFTDSITSEVPYTGYVCDDFAEFKNGECFTSTEKSEMGFFATLARDVYTNLYLYTGSKTPFARRHYKISVQLGRQKKAREERGKIFITIIGTKDRIEKQALSDDYELLYPDRMYSRLIAGKDVGRVVKVEYYWIHSSQWLRPDEWNILRFPEIKIKTINIFQDRQNDENTFCPNKLAVNNKDYGIRTKCTAPPIIG